MLDTVHSAKLKFVITDIERSLIVNFDLTIFKVKTTIFLLL